MQRTEILLEDNQYQHLLKEAGRLKISLAELLNKIVEGYLSENMPPDAEDPLEKLVGIGRGTGEAIGRQHNRWLYSEHTE